MECEICGVNTPSPKVIMVEGSRVTVCPRCVSHGTLVGNYGGEGTVLQKRSRYGKEDEFETVPDYDARVRTARQKRGWKQEELAAKINEPASSIANIENGKLSLSKQMAQKLEKALGISLFETGSEELKIEKSDAAPVTLGDVVKIRKR